MSVMQTLLMVFLSSFIYDKNEIYKNNVLRLENIAVKDLSEETV